MINSYLMILFRELQVTRAFLERLETRGILVFRENLASLERPVMLGQRDPQEKLEMMEPM